MEEEWCEYDGRRRTRNEREPKASRALLSNQHGFFELYLSPHSIYGLLLFTPFISNYTTCPSFLPLNYPLYPFSYYNKMWFVLCDDGVGFVSCSHLQGMFSRTIRLLEAGIKPVYISIYFKFVKHFFCWNLSWMIFLFC